MEREHWHWKPQLQKEANAGSRNASIILAEGEYPGRYFDGMTHMFDVISVIRQERKNGATHIGIFGSRTKSDSRGRRVHRPLDSDVDILVVKDKPEKIRETIRTGVAEGINIVRLSKDQWEHSEIYDHDDTVIRQIMNSVRWLWIKKGNYPLRVGRWFKRTF